MEILACPLDRLENFAAPYCFCLHKWIFLFPTRACEWVAWTFLFSPSLEILGFSSLAGLEEVGSSFVLADLEARRPLSLTVHSFFLQYCLGWGFEPWCTESPSREPELRVCPTLVMKPWYFRSSLGLEASWRKEGLNPGLWSQNLSLVALVQTRICYANSPGSVVAGYIV